MICCHYLHSNPTKELICLVAYQIMLLISWCLWNYKHHQWCLPFKEKNSKKVMRFQENAKIHGLWLLLGLKCNKAKMGKCTKWSLVWRKDMFMGPKSSTLDKHAINKKATKNMPHIGVNKNKWYINKKCHHVQNQVIFTSTCHSTLIEQM